MSIVERDWQEEQTRVQEVINIIDNRIDTLQEQVGGIQADIVDIRKNFWEDVTVNFDDAHEAAETYASIKQQAEVLSERERSHRHAQKQLKTMLRLMQTPYFGRIDFQEEGEPGPEQIYLGIASLLDDDEASFLIYDWRAPVASLYYDYPPGPASYETPGGTIEGTMDLKRQYIIRDGQIRSMFDTGVTIGDELLQNVLGKQSDTQMKSIVATIQREQNRIIRNERSRLLIVQGAAGSGKTSAALQRVAYLLYRYRETLRAEQIVLFSPNPMFNSYVSTVLPELGEENMQQTTFQEYLERRIGETFRLEDPFMQLEYVHTASSDPGYSTRLAGIHFKSSAAFLQVLERYIDRLGQAGLRFYDIQLRGETLISAEQIAEHFYSLDRSYRIPNRITLVVQWLLSQLDDLARKERKKHWVEDEIELLDQDDYRKVYGELRKRKRARGDTFDDHELEHKLLAKMVVDRYFEPIRAQVKRLRFIDMPSTYKQLFTEPEEALFTDRDSPLPAAWKDICNQTVERLNRSELTYEDATPFLYLKERIEGFRTNTSVQHIFIDEAQDYSPLQFAFLKRLFPYSKMTVLGDLNQAIHAHSADNAFSQLAALFEETQTETIILTRSYRSTRQIIQFTQGMIPGGDQIEPFNRDGQKPTVTKATDLTDLNAKIEARVHALQAEGHRTIAIICKTAQESRNAYEALQAVLPLRLIEKETVSFAPGILVIPAYLAKGVEFDAVIIYNASQTQYGEEKDRKLFYTACTRAMHELHLYYLDVLSSFVQTLSSDTYTQEGS